MVCYGNYREGERCCGRYVCLAKVVLGVLELSAGRENSEEEDKSLNSRMSFLYMNGWMDGNPVN